MRHAESEECTKKSLHNCDGTSWQPNTSTCKTVNEIINHTKPMHPHFSYLFFLSLLIILYIFLLSTVAVAIRSLYRYVAINYFIFVCIWAEVSCEGNRERERDVDGVREVTAHHNSCAKWKIKNKVSRMHHADDWWKYCRCGTASTGCIHRHFIANWIHWRLKWKRERDGLQKPETVMSIGASRCWCKSFISR